MFSPEDLTKEEYTIFKEKFWRWFDSLDLIMKKKFWDYHSDTAELFFFNRYYKVDNF